MKISQIFSFPTLSYSPRRGGQICPLETAGVDLPCTQGGGKRGRSVQRTHKEGPTFTLNPPPPSQTPFPFLTRKITPSSPLPTSWPTRSNPEGVHTHFFSLHRVSLHISVLFSAHYNFKKLTAVYPPAEYLTCLSSAITIGTFLYLEKLISPFHKGLTSTLLYLMP